MTRRQGCVLTELRIHTERDTAPLITETGIWLQPGTRVMEEGRQNRWKNSTEVCSSLMLDTGLAPRSVGPLAETKMWASCSKTVLTATAEH